MVPHAHFGIPEDSKKASLPAESESGGERIRIGRQQTSRPPRMISPYSDATTWWELLTISRAGQRPRHRPLTFESGDLQSHASTMHEVIAERAPHARTSIRKMG